MTPRTLVPVALLATCALLGCGGPKKGAQDGSEKGPVPVKTTEIAAGQEASLVPLVKGTTWVYDVEAMMQGPGGSQQNRTEITLRVTKVEDKPDGKYATVEFFNEKDVKIESVVWRLNDKGLYEISDVRFKDANDKSAPIPNEPPLPTILFPVDKGAEAKLTVSGLRPDGSKGPGNVTVTIEGMQEIDTDMGRYSALSVVSETKYKSGTVEHVFGRKQWWVPDVGLARMVMSLRSTTPDGRQLLQSSTLRLKSKSP